MSFLNQFKVENFEEPEQALPAQITDQKQSTEFLRQFEIKPEPEEERPVSLLETRKEGISDVILEFLRDIGIPIATATPQLFATTEQLGGALGQRAGTFLGEQARRVIGKEPLAEEEKTEIQKQLEGRGVFDKNFPITTENTTRLFDSLTDGRIRRISEKRPEMEKSLKNLIKDFGLFLTPQGPFRGMSILRAIGSSLLRNLGSRAMIDAGFVDKENEDYVKFGLDVFSAFVGNVDLRKTGGKMIGEAEKSLGNTIWTNNDFPKELKNLRSSLAELGGEVSKSNKPAIEVIDSILQNVESGTFEAGVVSRGVQRLNEVIGDNIKNPKAVQQLGRIRSIYQSLANDIGQQNPDFLRLFNDGNAMVSASYTGNVVTNWLDQKIDKSVIKEIPLVSGLFKLGGRIGTKALDFPADIANKLVNKPRAMKFYIQLILKSLNLNSGNIEKDAKALEKELEKD